MSGLASLELDRPKTGNTCADCGAAIQSRSRRCVKCNGSDPEFIRRRHAAWLRRLESDPIFRAKLYGPVLTRRGAISPKRPALDRWQQGFDVADNGCWLWRGAVSYKGYCTFRDDSGRKVAVHRFAYEVRNGPIPAGLVIDHLCRDKRCCNPDHLEAVTNAVNTQRGLRCALRTPPTHCIHGHAFTPENSRFTGGKRRCAQCMRERNRRYYAERRRA